MTRDQNHETQFQSSLLFAYFQINMVNVSIGTFSLKMHTPTSRPLKISAPQV